MNRQITIEAYNNNAGKYASLFMDFKSYKEKMSRFQHNYLPKKAYILDVGCGPGNNAQFLAGIDDSYKIEGFDLSVEMINIAKLNVPGGNFWVQDITDIKPDKKYDAIIASFCIVHLSNEETISFVQKISKMLNEKGTLYLSFMEGKKAGIETTSFSDDYIFFNYYERNKIKKLLAENSIKTVEMLDDDYQEEDGSITKDVFIFAQYG
ncbi:MAG: class I SAM-dependent methyltransferase [Desulfobacteraceae bacterium]